MITPQKQAHSVIPRIRPARVGEMPIPPIDDDAQSTATGRGDTIGSTLPLVAEHGGRAVGGVSLTLTNDRTALIHDLWINPDWSDTDLTLRMMLAALEHGRKLGCLKADTEPSTRALTIIAILLDSGLLTDCTDVEPKEATNESINCSLKP